MWERNHRECVIKSLSTGGLWSGNPPWETLEASVEPPIEEEGSWGIYMGGIQLITVLRGL